MAPDKPPRAAIRPAPLPSKPPHNTKACVPMTMSNHASNQTDSLSLKCPCQKSMTAARKQKLGPLCKESEEHTDDGAADG
jgi:hypothetical protein